MSKFFSKSKMGFYDDSVVSVAIPDDAEEISIELYLTLMSEIANGKVLSTDNTDHPIAITPTISAAQLLQNFVSTVKSALNESDTTMLRIQESVSLGSTTFDASDVVAWVQYRRLLRQLLISTTVGILPARPPYPAGT